MNSYKIFLLLLLPLQGWGQENFLGFLPEESELIQNQDCQSVRLSFQIEEGYYIQANEVFNENFIPTQIQLENQLPIEIQKILFPKAEIILLGGIERIAVFRGKIEVWIEFESHTWSSIPIDQLQGSILFQACNKQKCFFPRSLAFELPMEKKLIP
ncbi:MAG: protein-disulfide reductase DsbD domain-containing protein [Bacteroidota bacterium]